MQAQNSEGAPRPRRGISDQLKMSHANLNKKDMQKRYNNNEAEQPDETRGLVEERRGCFTENYLVFSLQEKLPQLTTIYLDKEDDVLDYCKTVNFNRNARRMQLILNSGDNPNSSQSLPDEIDGDERGTVKKVSATRNRKKEDAFAVDQSMYADEDDGRVKRYSLVNNDPSFKSYTQDPSVFDQQSS